MPCALPVADGDPGDAGPCVGERAVDRLLGHLLALGQVQQSLHCRTTGQVTGAMAADSVGHHEDRWTRAERVLITLAPSTGVGGRAPFDGHRVGHRAAVDGSHPHAPPAEVNGRRGPHPHGPSRLEECSMPVDFDLGSVGGVTVPHPQSRCADPELEVCSRQ